MSNQMLIRDEQDGRQSANGLGSGVHVLDSGLGFGHSMSVMNWACDVRFGELLACQLGQRGTGALLLGKPSPFLNHCHSEYFVVSESYVYRILHDNAASRFRAVLLVLGLSVIINMSSYYGC